MASFCSDTRSNLQQSILKAAFAGNLETLKRLAKELDGKGEGIAKVLEGIRDSKGKGVLHTAVAGTYAGKMNVCKYLVEELKLDVNDQDETGETPLHGPISAGDYVTAAYLLDHGARPTVAMDKGMTPLHLTATKGHKKLLHLLISKGAEVEAQGPVGTPLCSAASVGAAASVEILLKYHANPNFVSDGTIYSEPPLMLAIDAKSIDCVRVLLKWGADPNITSCGMNPLALAVSEGETDIMKCLLNAGADANTPNFYGLAPIEIAAMLGNREGVVALFPVSTPIQSIPDWSIRGIFNYVNSAEFGRKRDIKVEEGVLEAKAKGAEAIKRGQYMKAACWYTQAMVVRPDYAELYSNRSFCWARLNEGRRALDDALLSIRLRKGWQKAHYRAGVAWQLLGNHQMAAKEFAIALKLDPLNKELQDAYREAAMRC